MKIYKIYSPRMAGKLILFYKVFQSRNANQYHIRFWNLWFSQQSTQRCLWISIKTNLSREKTCLYDRRKLQKRWLWPQDRVLPRPENTIKAENVRPRCFGIEKLLFYATRIVHLIGAIYYILHGILRVAPILWKAKKPTIVLTDNKPATRFIQAKAIPPELWNACD